uniref:Uncharacterized protein n=1 Tax=Knipowitschia caucasica TaxID=637954 RepID=A0AAV2L0V4_KNICA
MKMRKCTQVWFRRSDDDGGSAHRSGSGAVMMMRKCTQVWFRRSDEEEGVFKLNRRTMSSPPAGVKSLQPWPLLKCL